MFFSLLSLSFVLTMVLMGAEGNTVAQMSQSTKVVWPSGRPFGGACLTTTKHEHKSGSQGREGRAPPLRTRFSYLSVLPSARVQTPFQDYTLHQARVSLVPSANGPGRFLGLKHLAPLTTDPVQD